MPCREHHRRRTESWALHIRQAKGWHRAPRNDASMFCRQTPRGPYGPVLGLLLGWSKNGLKVATLVAVKCCDDDQFRAFCCATKLSDMEVLPSLGHWLARRDRPAGKNSDVPMIGIIGPSRSGPACLTFSAMISSSRLAIRLSRLAMRSEKK